MRSQKTAAAGIAAVIAVLCFSSLAPGEDEGEVFVIEAKVGEGIPLFKKLLALPPEKLEEVILVVKDEVFVIEVPLAAITINQALVLFPDVAQMALGKLKDLVSPRADWVRHKDALGQVKLAGVPASFFIFLLADEAKLGNVAQFIGDSSLFDLFIFLGEIRETAEGPPDPKPPVAVVKRKQTITTWGAIKSKK